MNVFFIRYEHFQPLWIFFLLLCFFNFRKSFFNCLDFLVALNLFFNCWIQFLIVATFLVVVNFSLFFVNLLDCCKCAFNLLRLFSFVVAVVDHCTLVAKMLCKLIKQFGHNCRLEVFCEKGVLENFAKFTENNYARLSSAGFWHKYFPVNFAKFSETSFLNF